MDCNYKDTGCAGDSQQSRRPRAYRQNSSFSCQRGAGNFNMSNLSGRTAVNGCRGPVPAGSAASPAKAVQNTCNTCRTPAAQTSSDYYAVPANESNESPCGKINHNCLTEYMSATASMPIGMAYTPYQQFTALYEQEAALCHGTIFTELDKPFMMTDCCQGGARS